MADQGERADLAEGQAHLQFRYDPKHRDRLAKAPWMRALQSGDPDARAVDHVYFDTPDHVLQRHGVTLRIDGRGKRRPPLPSLDRLRSDPDLRRFLSKRVFDSLRPVFATRVKRVTHKLKPSEDAEVALEFDELNVSANGARQPTKAFELALRSNDAHALYRLARLIAATVPVRLVSGPIEERAVALLEGRAPTFAKASPLALAPGSSGEEALIATVGNCLAHLSANEECAMAMADPEGVHQMRVALRRLDASLTVFGDMIPETQLDRLRRRIQGVTDALAPARDWDVFVDDVVGPVMADLRADDDLLILRGQAEARRSLEYRKVRRVLAAPSYAEMRLDLAAWLTEREWRQQPLTEDSVRLLSDARTLGAAILDKGHRKLLKRGKGLRTMDPAERHRLRIRVKKVRYAAELFAPLNPGKRVARYLAGLRALQDDLGRFNDVEVAHDLLQQLATGDPHRDRRIERAGGLVMGWHRHAAHERERDLVRHWREFTKAKPFWR